MKIITLKNIKILKINRKIKVNIKISKVNLISK